MGLQVVTDDQILEALRKSGGFIQMAADALGVSRQTIWQRLKDNPALEKAKWQIREGNIDLAENQLLKKVKQGFFPAVTYMLSRLGKSRDYTERTEVTGADGEPVVFSFTMIPASTLKGVDDDTDT